MNSKGWKKKLQEEVQPKELVYFIQKISGQDLTPIQFQGLLKIFCIDAIIRVEEKEEVEEVEVEELGAQASSNGMGDQNEGNDEAAPSKPRPRPYEELLSELIDRYIQLGISQRAEILALLEELEKENKEKKKPKHRKAKR